MMFIVLLIGALILIVGLNNTHGQLATALQKDVPGYLKWALAIAAIMAIGYIPGLRTPSRWLLALVVLVIVLKNYSTIRDGVLSFANVSPASVGAGPVAAQPTSTGAVGPQTHAELSGGAVIANNAPPAPPNPFDPSTYIGMFNPSTSGFGGAA